MQVGVGVLDQASDAWRHGQYRDVGHRPDVDNQDAGLTRQVVERRRESDVGVVAALIPSTAVGVGIAARLVGYRYELQLAGVDVGLGEGSVQVGLGQVAPDVAFLVLQRAVQRQAGELDAHFKARVGGRQDVERGPIQRYCGVFQAGQLVAGDAIVLADHRSIVVDDGGVDAGRLWIDHQAFEVVAGRRGDGDHHVFATFHQAVIDDGQRELDAGRALGNGYRDGIRALVVAARGAATVGQVERDLRVDIGRVAQCQGVGSRLAFGDRSIAGDADGGDVDGVADRGHDRSGDRGQLLVVATGHAGDGGADRVGTLVNIVADGVLDRAGGGADSDGDGLVVRQGHDNRRAGDWRADGGGVNDGAVFDGAASRDGSGQYDIGYVGAVAYWSYYRSRDRG